MALHWKVPSAKVDPVDPTPATVPTAPFDYWGANLWRARAFGLTRADRPQLFIIADALAGPGVDSETDPVDPLLLPAGIETLALLGTNTLRAQEFGNQNQYAADLMEAWGIIRHSDARATAPAWFTWSEGADATTIEAWATTVATNIVTRLQVPLDRVVLFNLDDEPEWWQRDRTDFLLESALGPGQFRTYLQEQGFVPGDFGGAVWGDVLPIGFDEVTGSVASHRLFYWTQRFVIASYFAQQVLNTAALRAHVNPTLFTALNYHNWVSRWYYPSTATQPIQSTGPGLHEGLIAPEWLAYGHLLAGGAHWTEDWFDNPFSEHWSDYAACLRSAALLNNATFGGYVVGLKLQEGHPKGGRYKALALLGQGAKVLKWYVFGPEQIFAGNGWSINGGAYEQIADANRLIAHAEDLLFPGQPLASRIAIMLPLSAQVWDLHVDSNPLIDAVQLPNWMTEQRGIYHALMHQQYQVDFLSEFDVPARLNNYDVLYVIGRNVTAAAQTTIASWIAAGGVAWFSPGSATSDEYDQPTTTLNAVRGITAQAIPTYYIAEDWAVTTPVVVLSASVAGQTLAAAGAETAKRTVERLTVTTATVLAEFSDDDGPAIVAQASGSGWAISAGYLLGNQYWEQTSYSTSALITGWIQNWRHMLALPARIAGVIKAVELDVEVVEPCRLDSAGGIAVTLLNWTGVALPSLTVTVHNCPVIERAILADTQAPVAFDQVGGNVTVTLPLESVDVLKLYAL